MHNRASIGETTATSIHLHVELLYLKARWQAESVLLAPLDDRGIRAFLYPLDIIKACLLL